MFNYKRESGATILCTLYLERNYIREREREREKGARGGGRKEERENEKTEKVRKRERRKQKLQCSYDTCHPCSVDISVLALKKLTKLILSLYLRIKNMCTIHKTPYNI